MKATDKDLGVLHGKLAASFIKALDSSDTAILLLDRHGEDLPGDVIDFLAEHAKANPALLTAVSKFLKDNDITCAVEDSEELSDLQKRLQTKQRKRVGNVVPIEE